MQSKKSHEDYHYKYVSDAPIKVDTKKYGASLQWKFDYSFLLGSLAQFIHSEIIVEVGVSAGETTSRICQLNPSAHLYGYDIWDRNGHLSQFHHYSSKTEVEEYLKEMGVNNYTLHQIDTIKNRKEFEKKLANDLGGEVSYLNYPKHKTKKAIPTSSCKKIDFAFVDAEHSYIGIKNDFEVVYPHMADHGIIAFHDTLMIDGCREFVYDLRNKYFDGTFDIMDLPFGIGTRRCGVTLLVKRSFGRTDRTIDQLCGSISSPSEIENNETKWLNGEIKKYRQNSFNYNKEINISDLDKTVDFDGDGHTKEDYAAVIRKTRNTKRKRGEEW